MQYYNPMKSKVRNSARLLVRSPGKKLPVARWILMGLDKVKRKYDEKPARTVYL
jgi:hypothetical protein